MYIYIYIYICVCVCVQIFSYFWQGKGGDFGLRDQDPGVFFGAFLLRIWVLLALTRRVQIPLGFGAGFT